jgi:hypothetical protein
LDERVAIYIESQKPWRWPDTCVRIVVDGLSVVMIEARSATRRVRMSPGKPTLATLQQLAGLAGVVLRDLNREMPTASESQPKEGHMTTSTFRRAGQDGAAVMPALLVSAVASPATAVESPAADDPVFAAIERCRFALKAYLVSLAAEPRFADPRREAWDEENVKLCHRVIDERCTLFETVPTTAAGAAAMIGFALELAHGQDNWQSLTTCCRQGTDAPGGVIKPMLDSLAAFLSAQPSGR